MGLLDVFKTVEEHLAANLDRLGQKVPKVRAGWKSTLKRSDSFPRLTWVPTGGPTKPTADQGADQLGNPRKLGTRVVGVEAHIWGAGIAEAEELAGHLAAACQEALPGGARVVHEGWDAGAETEFTQAGQLLVLLVEFDLAWTREVQTEAVIDAMPTSGAFVPAIT